MLLPQLNASVEAVVVVLDRFFGPVTSGSSRVDDDGGATASQPIARITSEIDRSIIRAQIYTSDATWKCADRRGRVPMKPTRGAFRDTRCASSRERPHLGLYRQLGRTERR